MHRTPTGPIGAEAMMPTNNPFRMSKIGLANSANILFMMVCFEFTEAKLVAFGRSAKFSLSKWVYKGRVVADSGVHNEWKDVMYQSS